MPAAVRVFTPPGGAPCGAMWPALAKTHQSCLHLPLLGTLFMHKCSVSPWNSKHEQELMASAMGLEPERVYREAEP